MGKFNQRITYWPLGNLDKYGKPAYGTPVVFNARIESNLESEQKDYEQTLNVNQKKTNHKIYTDSNIDFKIRAFVYIGETQETNPLNLQDTISIHKIEKISSVMGDKFMVVLYT